MRLMIQIECSELPDTRARDSTRYHDGDYGEREDSTRSRDGDQDGRKHGDNFEITHEVGTLAYTT